MTEGDTDTLEAERGGPGYSLGVILSLSAAVAAAIINIVQVALKNNYPDITKNHHLIVSCGAFGEIG